MAFWTPAVRGQLLAALRTRWLMGVRAGLAVGLPMLIGTLAGRPSWGALASLGGFAGFYQPTAPFRYRSQTVACVGLALAVVVPVSGLVADTAWLTVVWIAVSAGLASFVCLGLEVPPPREYMIVLALLAGTGIPVSGGGALRELWLVSAGALMSWMIVFTVELLRPSPDPCAAALRGAWEATIKVLSSPEGPEAQAARSAAVAAARRARVVIAQAGARRARTLASAEAAVEIILAAALSLSIDGVVPLAPGAIDILRRGVPGSDLEVPDAPLPLAHAVAAAQEVIISDSHDGPELESIAASARALPRLKEAARSRGVVVIAAVRIGVTVAAGAGIGRVIGLEHAYWVGLTAAAALQANNVTLLLRRSLHRVVGTVAGVALAGGVLAISRAGVFIAVVAGLAQAVAETVIAASYAIGITFVTVIALSIYELATSGSDLGAVIPARLLDTAIGATLVVILRGLLWPRSNASRLPYAQAEALRTTAELFRLRWLESGSSLAPVAHRLQENVLDVRALAADARADRVLARDANGPDVITSAVDVLAMLALGVPYGRKAPEEAPARAYVATWRALAGAIATGEPMPDMPLAELPEYPRTSAATRMLILALTPGHGHLPDLRWSGRVEPD